MSLPQARRQSVIDLASHPSHRGVGAVRIGCALGASRPRRSFLRAAGRIAGLADDLAHSLAVVDAELSDADASLLSVYSPAAGDLGCSDAAVGAALEGLVDAFVARAAASLGDALGLVDGLAETCGDVADAVGGRAETYADAGTGGLVVAFLGVSLFVSAALYTRGRWSRQK